jgi:calcineurin-like phosphoesterase
VRLCGALIEADPETGKAIAIERIELPAEPE